MLAVVSPLPSSSGRVEAPLKIGYSNRIGPVGSSPVGDSRAPAGLNWVGSRGNHASPSEGQGHPAVAVKPIIVGRRRQNSRKNYGDPEEHQTERNGL